jgi:hypothetical protein
MQDVLSILIQFLAYTWWFWVFLMLKPLWEQTWLFWRQEVYKKNLPWFMVEMKIPRETRKGPRAMEQALTAIHQLRNSPGNLEEKYKDGEVTQWFCLEMVSLGGEVHFYIRGDKKKRDLIEAQIFAYYPDVELNDVDDYCDRFPENIEDMHRQGYDLWGTEMLLAKHPAYPIKSYTDFEAPDEERQYDPISSFIEVLSKAKPEETLAIQILIAPSDEHWKEEGYKLVEKLSEQKRAAGGHKKGSSTKLAFPGGPLPVFEGAAAHGEVKKPELPPIMQRTPGQTNVLEAIENNLSKPSFETLIRFIYLAPKAIYYDSYPRRGLMGSFNQYASHDLNSFRPNMDIATMARFWNPPYIFSAIRTQYRKQRMLYNYKRRKLPPKTFMAKLLTSHFFNWNFYSKKIYLSVESIATLFHPPSFLVLTGPHVKRSESKKAGPPAGLAIFGEEAEIEHFK